MNDRPVIEYCDDADDLAERAALAVWDLLDDRFCQQAERVSLVATGGSTPVGAYLRLAKAPWSHEWRRVAVTLSDERWVAPTAPESNERMLRETLLTGPAAEARFVPLWSPAENPEAAARIAEPDVRALMPFDCILLGMGDDGHVASLFPGSPALEVGLDPGAQRLCIGVPAGEPAPRQQRISLTLRALLSGPVVLLISGEAKRRTLEAALGGADLPVRRILAQPRVPVRILWSP
jgi:6-phosphogluconolactonase